MENTMFVRMYLRSKIMNITCLVFLVSRGHTHDIDFCVVNSCT